MKVKLLCIFALLLTAVSGAWADQVTAEEALQQAQTFLTNRTNGPRRAAGATPQLVSAGRVCGLYVFNTADKKGFVIVSNDDATCPILGFSESGTIDPANIPSNMRAWLQGYADEIAWLQKQLAQGTLVKMNGQHRASRRAGSHSTASILPLISSQWNQGTPYNNLCPEYSEGKRAVTGCVATAMAQVMYYHKWPQSATTAIPAYKTDSYGINMLELPAITFGWANMINKYASGSYTDDQATAVATLMLYCGQSVQMNYGPSSGAQSNSVAEALKNYFGYNETTKYVSRSYYTADKWADMLYHELKNGRPVVYGGASSGGGHEFVCDGYKYENDQDYFHINWGWGGTSDEYFLLSTLNPYQQGIGGSSTRDGFHYGQDATIGIQKSTESGTTADITPNVINLTVNSVTSPFTPILQRMTVDMTLNVTNNSNDDYEGDIYLGYKSGDSYNLLDGNNCFIPAGETRDVTVPFTLPEEGTFDIVIFLPGADGWLYTNGKVAGTVTVTNAAQNEIVPVYGYRAGSYSRSQFIIPAQQMKELTTTDLPISLEAVTFYAANQSISWGVAEFDVYLAEVDETTFANTKLKDWNSLTKVYSGKLSISGGRMKITFADPYTYNGGNLLVGINQTKTGTYKSCVWIGTEATGASLGDYGDNITQQNFIPATTFDFSAAYLDLADNGTTNSADIENYDGKTVEVVLSGRTLYKDGYWNTLTLPFAVTIAGSPLAGDNVVAKVLNTSSKLDNGTLTLNFSDAPATIPAGTPFIIKWDNTGVNLTNPVFSGVTIDQTNRDVAFTGGSFKGNYAPLEITDANRDDVVLLAAGNKLGYAKTDRTIANGKALGAFRAYFDIPSVAGAPAISSYELNFGDDDATGIILIDNSQFSQRECGDARTIDNSAGAWYSLDGRKLDGKPTQKGLYINNGRKVVVK